MPPSGQCRIKKGMKKTRAIPVEAPKLSDASSKEALPLYLVPVVAGFPSPADYYLDRKLDLHEHLVRNSAAMPPWEWRRNRR